MPGGNQNCNHPTCVSPSGRHLEDDEDDEGTAERFDRRAQALAAGLGALAGMPFGPGGSIVGAVLGPLLVPLAEEVMREVGMDGRRRSGEALAAACEASGLSAEETATRALGNEKSRLLAATAIVAATHTTWEDKVRTLGMSLASGLLASDDAEVDSEQLIMSAIAGLEGPHLALLDLLVSWHPPRLAGDTGLHHVEISSESSINQAWSAGQRRWTTAEIVTYRLSLHLFYPVCWVRCNGMALHFLDVVDAAAGDRWVPGLEVPHVHCDLFPVVLDYPGHAEPRIRPVA